MVRRIWRIIDAAGPVAWIVSLVGGVAVTVGAVIGVAFEGLHPVLQVLLGLVVFVVASFAILAVLQRALAAWREWRDASEASTPLTSERTGIQKRGGNMRLRDSRIRNQDTAIDSEDSEDDIEGTDIE